jgi:hypothetical protein
MKRCCLDNIIIIIAVSLFSESKDISGLSKIINVVKLKVNERKKNFHYKM